MKKLSLLLAVAVAIAAVSCGTGGNSIPDAFKGLDKVADDFNAFDRELAKQHEGEAVYGIDTLYKKLEADLEALAPKLISKTIPTECNPESGFIINGDLAVTGVSTKNGSIEVAFSAPLESKDDKKPGKLYYICYDNDGILSQSGECDQKDGAIHVAVKLKYSFIKKEYDIDTRTTFELPSPARDRFMRTVQMQKIVIVSKDEFENHLIDKNGIASIKLGSPIDNIPQMLYSVYDKLEKKSETQYFEGGDEEIVEFYEASLNGHPVAQFFDYDSGVVKYIKVLSADLSVKGMNLSLDSTAEELISLHGEHVTNDGTLLITYRNVHFYGIRLTPRGYDKVSAAYLNGSSRIFLEKDDIEPLSHAEYIMIY